MRISDWSSDVCSSDLREQQAGALDLGDQAAEFVLELAERRQSLLAALADVLAQLRGERVQHRTGDVERARVAGHGVAVGATLVDARGVFGQRQHRQRVLAGVERLRVRLHVRRFLAFEAGVRSEEHTSELPSLLRISYAVFCLK